MYVALDIIGEGDVFLCGKGYNPGDLFLRLQKPFSRNQDQNEQQLALSLPGNKGGMHQGKTRSKEVP